MILVLKNPEISTIEMFCIHSSTVEFWKCFIFNKILMINYLNKFRFPIGKKVVYNILIINTTFIFLGLVSSPGFPVDIPPIPE